MTALIEIKFLCAWSVFSSLSWLEKIFPECNVLKFFDNQSLSWSACSLDYSKVFFRRMNITESNWSLSNFSYSEPLLHSVIIIDENYFLLFCIFSRRLSRFDILFFLQSFIKKFIWAKVKVTEIQVALLYRWIYSKAAKWNKCVL